MAAYFHGGSDVQSDGLQTLYLMNPGYVGGYPEAPVPANMLLLNSTSINPMGLPHSPQQAHQQQHFVGIPLQPPAGPSQDSGRQPPVPGPHDISPVHGLMPRVEYNLWTQPPGMAAVELSAHLGSRRPSAVPAVQQGLSLSLSPQQTVYSYRSETEVPTGMSPATAKETRASVPSSVVSVASTGISGLQSVLMGSKYLKVAQQLLEEVVSVGKGVKGESMKGSTSKSPGKTARDSEGMGDGDASLKRGADLTTAERQELQMKKAKLVNMLDEVEQRYRQYHHQMQIIVSSFEAVAGLGSAKTYTALALQTISKQFRCLRDAISGQIRATSKSLGEEDCLIGGTKSEGGSGLRFVDHQLRQQRALQQLGMIQQNAWRPQRGLPERSVSILRAWLFEHFLHPYPKDSDKIMLAKQTGLTRSQVSNWFINARVRLWKPMVEEMYLEEVKEQEHNNGDANTRSDANEGSSSKSSAQQENSSARTEQTNSLKSKQDYPNEPKPSSVSIPLSALESAPNHTSYNRTDALMRPMIEKARSNESMHANVMTHSMNIDLKTDETNNHKLFMKFGDPLIASMANNRGGFGGYAMGEIGRFDHEQFTPRFSGNGVSLTLGLPHSENLSVSATQPSYLSSESIPMGRRLDMGTEASDYSAVAQPSNVYESINIQSRKRFAAQLLPDFVA